MTTTWMNFTDLTLSEKSLIDTKKYILYYSIYMKVKNRPSEPMMTEIRIGATFRDELMVFLHAT